MDSSTPRWKTALAKLDKEFEIREAELKVLRELDQYLLRENTSLKDTCEFIAQALIDLTGADQAAVLMRRRNVLDVIASEPETPKPLPLPINDSVTGWCVINAETVKIDDTLQDQKFQRLYKSFNSASGSRMRSELAAPIKFGNVAVGVINIECSRSQAFDAHDKGITETLAGQTSLAFKKLRLFNEAEVFKSLQPFLLSDSPSADIAIQTILSTALGQLSDFLGEVKHFQILFIEGDRLVVAYSSSGKDINVRINITDSVSGEAVMTSRPIILDDVTDHPKYVRMLGDSIKSEMAVPIIVQGDITGILNFESEEISYFDNFASEIVRHFSAQMAWLLTLLSIRFEMSARMRTDRANEILKALGDQTGNLIHRLNNIVGPIKMQAEELQIYQKEILAKETEFASVIESIRKAATDALTLPAEMRRLFEEIEYVDANKIIIEILQTFPEKTGITIVSNLSAELSKLRCQGLGAVLHTLLENAVDAMPNGGRIFVTSANVRFSNLTDEFFEISIRDEGRGIPTHHLDRIFDWDFTTKEKRGRGGLGWGLPWVKTFVDRVNGAVAVDSIVGRGSTFRLRFPVAKATEGEQR
ncbi:GAF domain-containing protein [Bradyrhizobium sp. HKCCYLS3077]|uniref:GAF domain-containing sensor histidine kinase n=1 Tax=Bradyrhizobium sp. HKCCYLS3077 TaxID=3420761 RepID=UPI003EBF2259